MGYPTAVASRWPSVLKFVALIGAGVALACFFLPVQAQDMPTSVLRARDLDQSTGSRFFGTINERRKLLMSLTPMELEVLRRRKLKFEQLSDSQRDQVVQFHQDLSARDDQDELRLVMNRYYQWLKSLDEKTRRQLLDLEPNKRIERIKEELDKQAKASFGRVGSTKLPNGDINSVYDWIKQTILKKEDKMNELLNSPEVKAKLPKNGVGDLSRPARTDGRKNYRFTLLEKYAPELAQDLVFEEIDVLRARLSDEALQIIDSYPEETQKKLVLQWFRAAQYAQTNVSDAKLYRYWKSLPIEEQEQYENMSRADWRLLLEKRYFHNLRVRGGEDLVDEDGDQSSIEQETGAEETDGSKSN